MMQEPIASKVLRKSSDWISLHLKNDFNKNSISLDNVSRFVACLNYTAINIYTLTHDVLTILSILILNF